MVQSNYDYVIIGAGIAGLSYACKLEEQGLNFLIIDKAHCIGGSWQTLAYNTSLYEFGPNTLIASDELLEIIKTIGFESELIKKDLKNSKRYLYLKNKLIEVSFNPLKFFSSDLLSLKGKLRLFLEPFKKRHDNHEESVYEFASRKFGKEAASNLIDSALQGIWAGDSKRLSAKSALRKIYQLEEQYGSIFTGMIKSLSEKSQKKPKPKSIILFRQGMQSFTNAIAEYLGKENILLNCKTKIKENSSGYDLDIQYANQKLRISTKNLIIATKAFEAGELLQTSSLRLSGLLQKTPYAPVFLSAFSIDKKLFSKQKQNLFNAFGFIDAKSDHLNLGTIFASELAESRKLDDEFLLLSFAGGMRNPQILDFDNESIIETLKEELCSILNKYGRNLKSSDFKLINFARIEQAIPQYHLGHEELIRQIYNELKLHPGLELLGNYLAGVSVPDTIRYSQKNFTHS